MDYALLNTGINCDPTDKQLAELFGGRGDMFLKDTPARLASERGYGNMTNKKKPLKPSYDINTCFPTPKLHTGVFNMVKSDFPKGAGGVEPNPMWADGTYDQMKGDFMRQAERQIESENIRNIIPERDLRYDLAKYSGGTAQQNKLDFAITETLTEEQRIKEDQIRKALERAGFERREIEEAISLARVERQADLASSVVRLLPGKKAQDYVRNILFRREIAKTDNDAPLAQNDYEQLSGGISIGTGAGGSVSYESVSNNSHPYESLPTHSMRSRYTKLNAEELEGVGSGLARPAPLFAGGGGSGGGMRRGGGTSIPPSVANSMFPGVRARGF
jgi:hypothetical protein